MDRVPELHAVGATWLKELFLKEKVTEMMSLFFFKLENILKGNIKNIKICQNPSSTL